jgi:hypothetical protein
MSMICSIHGGIRNAYTNRILVGRSKGMKTLGLSLEI